MTNRYLLTGAGFSKAFGGLLCDELTAYFFNALAADKTIQKDIVQKLSLKDFEEILSEIRACRSAEEVKKFEGILQNLFQRMFDSLNLQPTSGSMEDMVEEFLWNFNCIFTLNQESFFRKANRLCNKGFSHRREESKIVLSAERSTDRPYLELHGAYDWEGVFILGDNKEEEIKSRPQLQKYHDFFTECLSEKNSKLVIIGYSFCDEHINKIIEAAMTKGLEIFIWDPKIKTYLSRYSTGPGLCPDSTPSINKTTLEKALRGYLPKNFSLKGGDKNEVKRFLEN